MSAAAPARGKVFDRLGFARGVLRAEAGALFTVADRLGPSFETCCEILAQCRGRVAISGVGKCAEVGRKIAATMNSMGTRAYTLDATAAMHGDLGMVSPEDVALLLSHSGESEELLRVLGPLEQSAASILAITGNAGGTLARAARAAIVYGPVVEACPHALAPSTSTTVMLALGDALAFTLAEMRQFTPADFARYHPAGSLGRKLAAVTTVMRHGEELRVARASQPVREVFARARHEGRRTGAIILTSDDGKLVGLFTDSDLARLFEARHDAALDAPIAEVMTRHPVTITADTRLAEAVELMSLRKISELPVVDPEGIPIGLVDITDLIGWEPVGNSAGVRPALRLVSRLAE